MQVVTTSEQMTQWAVARKQEGQTIGLVPTMGFLHAGHVSLMRILRSQVDALVVSIYVNPLQFGANEDLDKYPTDREGDLAKCASAGVDAVFMPADLYPDGFKTSVVVHELTDRLCGAKRAGHFEGVTTVCTRLFGVTRADRACFGDKDFQQLTVIRQLVRDLALPVQIVPGPLVRDDDGLALSSRNTYLTAEERQRALGLNRSLKAIQTAYEAGEHKASTLLAVGRAALKLGQDDRLDYYELVDALSLEPLEAVVRPARALVAAVVGRTRLIDNAPVGPAWT